MSSKKQFFLSLFGTLAIILPIYIIFGAISISKSRTATVDNTQTNVPIAQPSAQDAKNILIICKANNALSSFALVRFDALENKIVTASLAKETIVLLNKKPLTLYEAAKTAGPAQAAAGISETLGIIVNNYIQIDSQIFAQMTHSLGVAHMLLANYISEESLVQLKLSVPGIENVSLSPIRLLEVLESGLVPRSQLDVIRSDGYLAFLKAGREALHESLPAAFKKYSGKFETDISATDIYEYERILKFLTRGEAEFKSAVFEGTWADERFELGQSSPQTAIDFFA